MRLSENEFFLILGPSGSACFALFSAGFVLSSGRLAPKGEKEKTEISGNPLGAVPRNIC